MEDLFLASISKQEVKDIVSEAFKQQVAPYVYALVNVRDETEIITKKEAARLLKVSEKTIEEWTRQGIIPGHRIGHRIRYKKSELDNCLKPIRNQNHISKP